MAGRFVLSAETPQETLDWGQLRWMSHPPTTGSTQLTVIEVSIMPGQGHDFHKHPDQEEVIYVISGQVEQWLERESAVLRSGDSLFIAADTVHASFNSGDEPARLLAILGPCVGEFGYELVDVAAEEPWGIAAMKPVPDERAPDERAMPATVFVVAERRTAACPAHRWRCPAARRG